MASRALPDGGPTSDGPLEVQTLSIPIADRLHWLDRFAAGLRRQHDRLVATVVEELGKPAWEVTLTEMLPLLASIHWHRRHLKRLLGPKRQRGGAWWQWGDAVRTERTAVGRVLLIATWNYPIQLLGVQLVQSIAAGNETWVKPSERSPRAQSLLLSTVRWALGEAGIPQDMLVECDASREEGERLLREHHFDHVLFTGSTAVGRSIAEIAASRLMPTTLELSGHDSAIVCADADLDLAARSIWQAVLLNAGQTCMAPRRVLVEAAAYRHFLGRLAPLAAATSPLTMVDASAATRTFAAVRDALQRGGRSLSGVVEPPNGRALRPHAVADATPESTLFAGEHFGPAVAMTSVADLNEAFGLHRSVGQALATSVFTRSPKAIRARAASLGTSFVTINDCVRPTSHPATALAGRGTSGWGASRGASGLLALTREVTVTERGWLTPPPEAPSERLMVWIRRWSGLTGGHP
jgi:acyl-CoA reductase-like NAD-dependent aldehyde dehydrogenase